MNSKVQIAVDRGGTFTDIWANIPGTGEVIFKILSEDPDSYNDAPAEGVRRVLEIFTDSKISKGAKLNGDLIEWIRMGTTVGTNALLEKKGDRFLYVTSESLGDVLEIGTQARPDLFDLNVRKPKPLYSAVLEVEERVTIETASDDPNQSAVSPDEKNGVFLTHSGHYIRVLKPLNRSKTHEDLKNLYERGYRNIAVCLAHSFTYNIHELEVKEIAEEIGYEFISLSSQLAPSIGLLNRGNSVCIDAYLTPKIQNYVKRFFSSFENPPIIEFMKSDGGLVKAKDFNGLNSILSGPAGGAVGSAQTADDGKTPVLGFDMGGTSTDVYRFHRNHEIVYENTISGIDIHAPQLQIHTVAAGGGSILKFENDLFHVGPESSSANPGPACYRKGGPLTITDANLILKRLDPSQFPEIFGMNANEPLDEDATVKKFQQLTDQVNKKMNTNLTAQEVALGFLDVANETMARSIREISEARGYSTKDHVLTAFGGAGGQHCCSVAKILGISRVVIHNYSSVLSAYGMALAKCTHETKEPFSGVLGDLSLSDCKIKLDAMAHNVKELFCRENSCVSDERLVLEKTLGLKFKGSNTILQVPFQEDSNHECLAQVFFELHKREFGFLPPANTKILINYVRVQGIYENKTQRVNKSFKEELAFFRERGLKGVVPNGQQEIYFGKKPTLTNVYRLKDLKGGSVITGPALITAETQTLLVEDDCEAIITSNFVVIEIGNTASQNVKQESDVEVGKSNPALLSVFGNRFMGIAEQMGRTLQRTSISTSIKERLDFSCAIFSSDGGLVANAPHIPVHLGSMQYAIEYQHKLWKGRLAPGDVLLSNHPEAGGTHLPDLTVITPVFNNGEVVFYVASRGHHQDIGGIGITAMMPNSKELWQEGVSIKSFKLVEAGKFDEDGVRALFDEAANYPGSSATRNIEHNISDLKAQVSANQRGINLVQDLFKEHGFHVVEYNMKAIRLNAETAVRNFFRDQAFIHKNKALCATDYFDDGTKVQVKITIDPEEGEALFDFDGTEEEVYGCMNSPPSITYSCVIYVLRCLINQRIPLNQGCLAPCKFNIPKGSILNPTEFVAICGSTIAGQRITDVLLKAFGSCAASQGCANSFGFGTGGKDPITGEVQKGFTYAEAIGGGVGAGPWGGKAADACNVHCTNTRTTDIEVIESRTPVVVTEWKIRRGTGGSGKYCGGDGCVREIEARIPLRVSILSERRVFAPYGLHGGEGGTRDKNYWLRRLEDGTYSVTKIGNKEIFNILAGDRVQINTPGGGGYGARICSRQ